MSKTTYPAGAVCALIAHAVACEQQCPVIFQMCDARYRIDGKAHALDAGFPSAQDVDMARVPPTLHLVGDDGIYLMSSGIPRQIDESTPGDKALVAYAIEASPNLCEFDEWWAAKQALFGGDDGVDALPVGMVYYLVESMSADRDQVVYLDLTPERIQIPRGRVAQNVRVEDYPGPLREWFRVPSQDVLDSILEKLRPWAETEVG